MPIRIFSSSIHENGSQITRYWSKLVVHDFTVRKLHHYLSSSRITIRTVSNNRVYFSLIEPLYFMLLSEDKLKVKLM